MFFCSSSCHGARQRSIRLLGCLEGAVGTVRVFCLACPNLYIFGSHPLPLHFFHCLTHYIYTNLFLYHFSRMRLFSFFRDDIQWGKRSRNKGQKYISREELYSRASLGILHLNMSQTPKICGSRIIYFYPISWMFKLCLQVTLLDRMLWLILSLLAIAECDIKTCIINKTACDLGFQPVVGISEDGCCPIFSCSKYHVFLRWFFYSLVYFIFSKCVKIISSSLSPFLSAFIGALLVLFFLEVE